VTVLRVTAATPDSVLIPTYLERVIDVPASLSG